MSIDKKIKNYADNKMEELKNNEFFDSINDTHFSEQKKPKSQRKLITSVAVSLVAVFAIIVTLSFTIQNINGYNSSQYNYNTRNSTVEELNEDCMFYKFSEKISYSVILTTDCATDEKLFYDVNCSLNDNADSFSFMCIVNLNHDYSLDTYEHNMQFGAYEINYNLTIEYDENNRLFTHNVNANLITDNEKIVICYVGLSTDENNRFFESLSEILISK